MELLSEHGTVPAEGTAPPRARTSGTRTAGTTSVVPADATLPPGTDAAVRVRGLRKDYPAPGGGVRRAVSDLDLDVARGEVVALLGPNGAGKTTVTEVLEGHRHRDAGEVEVLGRDPWRAPLSWRARVGIVLQDTSEPLQLTVAELLRHWATFTPRSRDPREVAALVGLEDRFGARVATLSGGQRRRLDVALGIVGRPELLFLDEPTTGFDPTARLQFWDVVAGLRAEGTTILLTTHYLDEAARLADRVVVVADGRLVAAGTPDDLGGPLRDVSVVRWRDADGAGHEHRTTDPTRLLRRLLDEVPGEVAGLQVRPTSLEEVYLQLVAPTTTATEDAA